MLLFLIPWIEEYANDGLSGLLLETLQQCPTAPVEFYELASSMETSSIPGTLIRLVREIVVNCPLPAEDSIVVRYK